jgi:hypothetical protein
MPGRFSVSGFTSQTANGGVVGEWIGAVSGIAAQPAALDRPRSRRAVSRQWGFLGAIALAREKKWGSVAAEPQFKDGKKGQPRREGLENGSA